MTNHLCFHCHRECDCDGYHMMTDCVGCTICAETKKLKRELAALAEENARLRKTLEEL